MKSLIFVCLVTLGVFVPGAEAPRTCRRLPANESLSLKAVQRAANGNSIVLLVDSNVGEFSHAPVKVSRVLANYAPDPSFHVQELTGDHDSLLRTSVLLTGPDDRITVGGNYYHRNSQTQEIFLRRYLEDGRPDTDFGENGEVSFSTDAGSTDTLLTGHILPDGSYLLGIATYQGTRQSVSVLRVPASGGFDGSYGQNGTAHIPGLSRMTMTPAFLFRADGSTIVAVAPDDTGEVRLFALSAEGEPLAGFGTGGVAGSFLPNREVLQIAGDKDGGFALSATKNSETLTAIFRANGEWDTSYLPLGKPWRLEAFGGPRHTRGSVGAFFSDGSGRFAAFSDRAYGDGGMSFVEFEYYELGKGGTLKRRSFPFDSSGEFCGGSPVAVEASAGKVSVLLESLQSAPASQQGFLFEFAP